MAQIIITESLFVPFEALFFTLDKDFRPFSKYDINKIYVVLPYYERCYYLNNNLMNITI